MNRVYVCSCFGITEKQVRAHADTGACTPRQIASACKAGTDCGGCVRRIQALLGRGGCPRPEQDEPVDLVRRTERAGRSERAAQAGRGERAERVDSGMRPVTAEAA
ncbi:(2Fe-2S)-binding protein [Streptomyces sp. H27-D2]|uniref:(2Fe-2S)-binding protein n=1 Tax=Streptomyces sp. H27-D2 TaxID=3046304 RepID=UPI002DB7145E|nr:(2Fe-2S)-binding protein [Streptomyces sp. H27-D2]MEC4018948.1 (2Fe-2S)-binding protein [Streptomyces sp. H27-D2]